MGTWIVGIIVFAIVAFAGYRAYRNYKTGNGCGCDCDGCSSCPKSDDSNIS